MSSILHIETSTEICSVALSENGDCLYHQENTEGPNHAKVLASLIESAVSFSDSHAIPIQAVAVSAGPGSYTGLRIGVSSAKGVCYGREIPLIALSTLKILSVPVLLYHELPEDALICPMIDARRMEVYAAIYDRALKEVRPVQADIVTHDTYLSYLEQRPVYFFGNGAEKCMEVINHPNAHFIAGITPQAKYMFPLAERAFLNGAQPEEKIDTIVDTAYFEPFYLKDFVATTPKKLI